MQHQLYARSVTKTVINKVKQGKGWALTSDRLYAYFDTAKGMESFAKRAHKLLALMHNPKTPNHAGFLFALDSSFGKDNSKPVNSIMVYPEAMGFQPGEMVPACEGLSEDDIAHAAVVLMGRKWDLPGEPDFSETDGTWASFEAFFMKHSVHVEEAGDGQDQA